MRHRNLNVEVVFAWPPYPMQVRCVVNTADYKEWVLSLGIISVTISLMHFEDTKGEGKMRVWTLYYVADFTEEGLTCDDPRPLMEEIKSYSASQPGCGVSEGGLDKFGELLKALQPGETASYGIWQVECRKITEEEYEALGEWEGW